MRMFEAEMSFEKKVKEKKKNICRDTTFDGLIAEDKNMVSSTDTHESQNIRIFLSR